MTDLVTSNALDESKQLLEEAAAAEQLELLAPPTPEEIADAREELGETAGHLTVLRHARENRRGRPKGARNKRTDDFARYISQFGQDPAITLMQIQSTSPEVLVALSKRTATRVLKDGTKIEYEVETLTYEAAQSLRIRCAEALMPFIHSKKPVAVDHTIRGVRVVEEAPRAAGVSGLLEGEAIRVLPPEDEA